MKSEFQPESFCALKSGGPVMVITAFYPGHDQEFGDTVETMWFNAQGDVRREVFATRFLKIFDPEAEQRKQEEMLRQHYQHEQGQGHE